MFGFLLNSFALRPFGGGQGQSTWVWTSWDGAAQAGNPFDPFGFYGSQSGSEEDSSDPNQNTYYYYWSSNDDPNRQQYQWNYRRPRRSPLGVLGKIVMIWLIIQFLLSMLGSCSVRRYYPSYYYGYTDGSGSAYSDGYTSENASYTWTQTTGQNGSRN